MDYQLNTDAAKSADAMSGRIEETGKYIGVFTRAEDTTSAKGTHGIDFSFRDKDGMTVDWMTVWTMNKDGKEIFGYKVLMAMMTCMKLKGITKQRGVIQKYDQDLKKRIDVKADIYPDLMNKPIGLLLVREEYAKGDQSIGFKMVPTAAFDPDTELTASEILARKTKPELLEKMAASLRDRPIRENKPAQSSYNAPSYQSGGGFDDSDIPFAAMDWRV